MMEMEESANYPTDSKHLSASINQEAHKHISKATESNPEKALGSRKN